MQPSVRNYRLAIPIIVLSVFAAALLFASSPQGSGRSPQIDETRGTVIRRASDFVVAPGFVGPKYDDGGSGRVVVLTDTIAKRPGATTWTATGFLQNETGTLVRITAVTGLLSDAAGKELRTIAASTPLATARAGEPVPFVASSDVAVDLVASVTWKVTYVRGVRQPPITAAAVEDTVDPDRTLEFTVYWRRPYGNSDRRYGYPQDDAPEGPYPYVVFGSLHNSGTLPAPAARALAAWLDKDGRVIHVDKLELRVLGRVIRSAPIADIAADGDVDFFYSNSNPDIAPLLADARMVLWGAASE